MPQNLQCGPAMPVGLYLKQQSQQFIKKYYHCHREIYYCPFLTAYPQQQLRKLSTDPKQWFIISSSTIRHLKQVAVLPAPRNTSYNHFIEKQTDDRFVMHPTSYNNFIGKQTDDCFVMRPQSPSRGCDINDSVTVT